MTRPNGFLGLALVVLAAVGLSAACGSSHPDCALNECQNSVSFQQNLDITMLDVPKLSISFCLNSACETLTPVVQSDGTYDCKSTGSASCLVTQDVDSGWSLKLAMVPTSPKNGDNYSVTVNETGVQKPLVSQTFSSVTYTPESPSGESCGVGCEQLILQ